jgi:hypothetical protein
MPKKQTFHMLNVYNLMSLDICICSLYHWYSQDNTDVHYLQKFPFVFIFIFGKKT